MKEKKDKGKEKVQYPAAELVQQACFDDYRRLIDTYDKIYEKVNISLAFCGIVLLVILGSVDYTYISAICRTQSSSDLFSLIVRFSCSVISAICIVWAVVQLLLLMRSKALSVFDSTAVRNDEIYRWDSDAAAVWLIDKYTIVVENLRSTITDKQKKYDSAVTKVIIALLLYSIFLIVEKGK